MRITIDIPDEKATRIIEGFCKQLKYSATVLVQLEETPNPETPTQFVRRKAKEFVLESAKAGEVQSLTEAARKEAVAKVDSELSI